MLESRSCFGLWAFGRLLGRSFACDVHLPGGGQAYKFTENPGIFRIRMPWSQHQPTHTSGKLDPTGKKVRW